MISIVSTYFRMRKKFLSLITALDYNSHTALTNLHYRCKDTFSETFGKQTSWFYRRRYFMPSTWVYSNIDNFFLQRVKVYVPPPLQHADDAVRVSECFGILDFGKYQRRCIVGAGTVPFPWPTWWEIFPIRLLVVYIDDLVTLRGCKDWHWICVLLLSHISTFRIPLARLFVFSFWQLRVSQISS